MNMQITDTYILDMNKDELRNFLYYNLDCSSFNNISEKTKLYCVLENPYSVVYMNNPSDDCLGHAIYLQPLIIWFYKNDDINISGGIEFAFELAIRKNKLTYFYNNIKKDCLYNNDQDKLSLIESLYITYSNIHKERYIDLYDKSIMYDRIQHLELALSKISDYFNYEILDKRNNGINLVNPTSNDEFVEIITNIAKTALKDSV